MMRAFLAGLALAGSFALPALVAPAWAADDECYGIATRDDSFTAAAVSPGPARLNFLDSPRANSTRANAFLVPGDVVVISRQSGGFGCASYLSTQNRATTGWLPMNALSPVPERRDAPTTAWTGTWRGDRTLDQSIEIRPRSVGMLHIAGSATWGRSDPERVSRGAIHSGSLQADTQAQGNILSFSNGWNDETLAYQQGDPLNCRARMLLLGPYMMVQDNLRCGGTNVSFSGVYRRVSGGE